MRVQAGVHPLGGGFSVPFLEVLPDDALVSLVMPGMVAALRAEQAKAAALQVTIYSTWNYLFVQPSLISLCVESKLGGKFSCYVYVSSNIHSRGSAFVRSNLSLVYSPAAIFSSGRRGEPDTIRRVSSEAAGPY